MIVIYLFNDKYALIFSAKDAETGIKDVMIKEGNGEWKLAESPYLLNDQSRSSIIKVGTADFSGNTTEITIKPIFNVKSLAIVFVAIVFGLLVLFYNIVRKKIYAHKK